MQSISVSYEAALTAEPLPSQHYVPPQRTKRAGSASGLAMDFGNAPKACSSNQEPPGCWQPVGAQTDRVIDSSVFEEARRLRQLGRDSEILANAPSVSMLSWSGVGLNTERMPAARRLIETDLPIKEVSQAAREELRIRDGRLKHLHIWWARRPLAACRAVICAALWYDPADPTCPPSFTKVLKDVVTRWVRSDHVTRNSLELRGRLGRQPSLIDDVAFLREAALRLIADFARWDNAHSTTLIKLAGELTRAASRNGTEKPVVLDSFAGGGAIPFEALRSGAAAVGVDLNPLAVLLNRVALEYVPRYGSRLAEIVEEHGNRIAERARERLAPFYPQPKSGQQLVGYLWARTVRCEGPNCGRTVPIIRSFLLSERRAAEAAIKLQPTAHGFEVEVVRGAEAKKVKGGTSKRSSVTCPFCNYTTSRIRVEEQAKQHGLGAQLLAVVYRNDAGSRIYDTPTKHDDLVLERVDAELQTWKKSRVGEDAWIPDEELPYLRSIFNVRVYGIDKWSKLFHRRQLLSALIFSEEVRLAHKELITQCGPELAAAAGECLALSVSSALQYQCSIATYLTESVKSAFIQGQSLPMKFDFIEANPFIEGLAGGYTYSLQSVASTLRKCASWSPSSGDVLQASCTGQLLPDDSVDALITDPPYYDVVPYADCSDFFIVWLRRMTAGWSSAFSRGALSPKAEELVQLAERNVRYEVKTKKWFEESMCRALEARRREVRPEGVAVIVFAHKGTDAWEALLKAVINAGWVVTASWPINTENETRMRANGSAVLGSSVHLVCRPREHKDGSLTTSVGEWRSVLLELPQKLHQWMPRLAEEGIAGADALFACLGPALEIFSRYATVEKASGNRVELSEYLEHVWAAISREALSTLLQGADTSGLEEDARVTAMWLWTLRGSGPSESETQTELSEATAPSRTTGLTLEFDMARKLAQGLGARLEDLASVLEVTGDTARLLSVEERALHVLGEHSGSSVNDPSADHQGSLFQESQAQSTAINRPIKSIGETTLDRIHQAMLLFGRGDSDGLKRLLVQEGVGRDPQFWHLAQALSALYPSPSDEKRWIDGVLARKKGLGGA